MSDYSDKFLEIEPSKGKDKNAYKKVIGIRRSWPSVFWALGPNGYSKTYKVIRSGKLRFSLVEKDDSLLNMASLTR